VSAKEMKLLRSYEVMAAMLHLATLSSGPGYCPAQKMAGEQAWQNVRTAMDTIAIHTPEPPELTRLVEEILKYPDVRVQYHRRKKPACAIASLVLSIKSMRLISWSRGVNRTESDSMRIFALIQKVPNKKRQGHCWPCHNASGRLDIIFSFS